MKKDKKPSAETRHESPSTSTKGNSMPAPTNLPKTAAFCSPIASQMEELSPRGFDWISLITTFLPLLFNLCPKPTPEEQQRKAQAAYRRRKNPPYTGGAIRMGIERAKFAAEENGVSITDEEALEVTVRTLDKLRGAEKSTFGEVWNEIGGDERTKKLHAKFLRAGLGSQDADDDE